MFSLREYFNSFQEYVDDYYDEEYDDNTRKEQQVMEAEVAEFVKIALYKMIQLGINYEVNYGRHNLNKSLLKQSLNNLQIVIESIPIDRVKLKLIRMHINSIFNEVKGDDEIILD